MSSSPPLIGKDRFRAFYAKEVEPEIENPDFFIPGFVEPRCTYMIFGRKGVGKTKLVLNNCFSADLGLRVWKTDLKRYVRDPEELPDSNSTHDLIAVTNVDILSSHRGAVLLIPLIKMIERRREKGYLTFLICSKSPGVLPNELLRLIDYELFIPLPNREERRGFINYLITEFVKRVSEKMYDIDNHLDDEDVDYLVECSIGATPAEIKRYLGEVFRSLLLHHDLVLTRKVLDQHLINGHMCAYNPEQLNKELHARAGVQREMPQQHNSIKVSKPPKKRKIDSE